MEEPPEKPAYDAYRLSLAPFLQLTAMFLDSALARKHPERCTAPGDSPPAPYCASMYVIMDRVMKRRAGAAAAAGAVHAADVQAVQPMEAQAVQEVEGGESEAAEPAAACAPMAQQATGTDVGPYPPHDAAAAAERVQSGDTALLPLACAPAPVAAPVGQHPSGSSNNATVASLEAWVRPPVAGDACSHGATLLASAAAATEGLAAAYELPERYKHFLNMVAGW